MTSLDDALAKAQPRTQTVSLCLRGDLIAEHERAVGELERAVIASELNEDDVSEEHLLALAGTIQQIEADMRDATVDFVLANIGRARWTALLAEHPPTDEQRQQFGRRFDHNPDKFPHAAIAACCTSPDGVTVEQVHQLEEVLSAGQWQALWSACFQVNMGGARTGESKAASDVLRRLRPSSEQPSDSASAEVSSTDVPSE